MQDLGVLVAQQIAAPIYAQGLAAVGGMFKAQAYGLAMGQFEIVLTLN